MICLTKCKECDVVDLGVNKVIRNDEEFQLCPNCGAKDSVEEINELEWEESMALENGDAQNELEDDCE